MKKTQRERNTFDIAPWKPEHVQVLRENELHGKTFITGDNNHLRYFRIVLLKCDWTPSVSIITQWRNIQQCTLLILLRIDKSFFIVLAYRY